MTKKIIWNQVKESNELIHKEQQIVKVQFLDEGIIDELELDDKVVEKYIFKVINLDNGKEMTYSTLSKRLLLKLMDFLPLKDKKVSILKKRIGNSVYDIDFDINSIQ